MIHLTFLFWTSIIWPTLGYFKQITMNTLCLYIGYIPGKTAYAKKNVHFKVFCQDVVTN